MHNTLTSLDVTKYIAACAKKVGISVVWEKETSPRTDGSTMWLPYVDAFEKEEQVVKLKQFVKHETSHLSYSDFGILEEEKPEGLLMFLTNLLEDHRVDYLNDSEYEGDKYNTEAYMKVFASECAKKPTSSEDAASVMAPLFAWDLDVRDDLWVRMADPFSPVMNAEGRRIYEKLSKGDYADALRNIRDNPDPVSGTRSCYELACRIIREVFDADPEKMKQPQPEASEGTKGEGEGDAESDGAGESGEEQKDGEGEDKRNEKLRTIDMKGAMASPYSEHKPKGEGVNATNYTCGTGSSYTPTPYDQIVQINFVTGEHRNWRRPINPDEHELAYINKARSHVSSLANQVRTQLQIISRDRWEYGKKRGKLNNSSLYRVGMKDAKGFNERLFKQQIRNETLDVSVQVLVDASGSMSGVKFQNAAAAACILNDVLGNALHIPLEIMGFTEMSKGGEQLNTMFIMKEFDRAESSDRMASNFAAVSNHLLDNVDGESLAFGYDRIKVRKEKRKLMIVLSDGSPCGGYSKGRTWQHTQRVIDAIEKSPIELIGVGLLFDGVKEMYKKWATIEDARSIEMSLLSLISNNILRSV